MPSKFGDTNLGADCREFYSAFYCCGERGKRDPGTQVGVFNDSVEILVNTLDGPTVRPLGIDHTHVRRQKERFGEFLNIFTCRSTTRINMSNHH
jgi:hypothetical protein